MMQQTRDRPDAELAQPLQRRVDRAPVALIERLWRNFLPQDRKAQRAQSEPRELIEIAQPLAMAAAVELAEVTRRRHD